MDYPVTSGHLGFLHVRKVMEAQLKWEGTLRTNALGIRYGDGLGERGRRHTGHTCSGREARTLHCFNRDSSAGPHSEALIYCKGQRSVTHWGKMTETHWLNTSLIISGFQLPPSCLFICSAVGLVASHICGSFILPSLGQGHCLGLRTSDSVLLTW